MVVYAFISSDIAKQYAKEMRKKGYYAVVYKVKSGDLLVKWRVSVTRGK